MRQLIIFLVRKYLGLRKFEAFQFANQRDKHTYYYFDDYGIMKHYETLEWDVASNVSFNYLLSNVCAIVHMDI